MVCDVVFIFVLCINVVGWMGEVDWVLELLIMFSDYEVKSLVVYLEICN